eukprot:6290591-Alexandrium_andersonii.AAC.1
MSAARGHQARSAAQPPAPGPPHRAPQTWERQGRAVARSLACRPMPALQHPGLQPAVRHGEIPGQW